MSESLAHDDLDCASRRDFEFLTLCGDEACRWVSEICADETRRIRGIVSSAFEALRKYDLQKGYDLLAAADQDLARRSGDFPSVTHILHRYRLTALAYFHYVNDELEAAKADLLQAHNEIKTVISLHDFLIPLAVHCIDFLIQRARVARRENQWKEVGHYLGIIGGIYAGDLPFCVLASGRPIRLADIRQFYASLPLNDEQRERAAQLLGEHIPLAERISYLEETVFALPDMVIPYP